MLLEPITDHEKLHTQVEGLLSGYKDAARRYHEKADTETYEDLYSTEQALRLLLIRALS